MKIFLLHFSNKHWKLTKSILWLSFWRPLCLSSLCLSSVCMWVSLFIPPSLLLLLPTQVYFLMFYVVHPVVGLFLSIYNVLSLALWLSLSLSFNVTNISMDLLAEMLATSLSTLLRSKTWVFYMNEWPEEIFWRPMRAIFFIVKKYLFFVFFSLSLSLFSLPLLISLLLSKLKKKIFLNCVFCLGP